MDTKRSGLPPTCSPKSFTCRNDVSFQMRMSGDYHVAADSGSVPCGRQCGCGWGPHRRVLRFHSLRQVRKQTLWLLGLNLKRLQTVILKLCMSSDSLQKCNLLLLLCFSAELFIVYGWKGQYFMISPLFLEDESQLEV